MRTRFYTKVFRYFVLLDKKEMRSVHLLQKKYLICKYTMLQNQ